MGGAGGGCGAGYGVRELGRGGGSGCGEATGRGGGGREAGAKVWIVQINVREEVLEESLGTVQAILNGFNVLWGWVAAAV